MKRLLILFVMLAGAWQAVAQSDFKILYGPYLQMVSDNEATVMWVTNKEAVSWVELAPDDGTHFYAAERPRFFHTRFGRKEVGRLHAVTLKDLEPGTSYRYRIYSREVMEMSPFYVQYGQVAATDVYRGEPFRFTTLDKSKPELFFRVVNDIHGNPELLAALTEGTKKAAPDFVFFNGDMVSWMNSEEQLFEGFMNQAVKDFASDIPLFLSRGNHETRGNFSPEFIRYFPTPTGTPYYMFRAGPAAVLVLDGGEDKPDSDREYWELADFDRYREDQAAWLREAVRSDEFRSAPFRIVMLHVPPVAGKNPWHGSLHLREQLVPVLNEAGIDLMICAHLHRHLFDPAGEEGCNFPILINSNRDVADVRADASRIEVEVRSEKQAPVGKWTFPVKK